MHFTIGANVQPQLTLFCECLKNGLVFYGLKLIVAQSAFGASHVRGDNSGGRSKLPACAALTKPQW